MNKKGKKNKKIWLLVILGLIVVGVVATIVYIAFNVPSPKELSTGDYPESSQVFDRNGKLLYEFMLTKEEFQYLWTKCQRI